MLAHCTLFPLLLVYFTYRKGYACKPEHRRLSLKCVRDKSVKGRQRHDAIVR